MNHVTITGKTFFRSLLAFNEQISCVYLSDFRKQTYLPKKVVYTGGTGQRFCRSKSIVASHSNADDKLWTQQRSKDAFRTSFASVVVGKFPLSAQPYMRLMRLDKPTGLWLLLWPFYWSVSLAADPGHIVSAFDLGLFYVGGTIARGVGCSINDLWDRKYDKQVQRTAGRPIASSEISKNKALAFTLFQIALGSAIVYSVQVNTFTIILGYATLVPIALYPLAKRYTNWPQLVLGLTFNWGAFVGWSFVHSSCYWPVVLPLYFAAVSWTMVYDTIYAHQDKVDDAAVGLKSTALLFGDKTKMWLSAFSVSMIANLVAVGVMSEQTFPYYAAVGLVGGHLTQQIRTLNINDPADCWKKFQSNSIIGLILFVGIVTGTLLKKQNGREKIPRDEEYVRTDDDKTLSIIT